MSTFAAWYEQRVFNPLMDRALRTPAVEALRARLLGGLRGEVLEVGLGTGLNLPHYHPDVRLRAVVREERLDERALRRASERGLELEHARGDVHELALPDASADDVVCTFVLCSVGDPARALREIARVLRPGGRLHLLEHVRSPRGFERAAQRVLTPMHRLWACGCALDRDLAALVARAGFDTRGMMLGRSAVFPFPASELLSGVARKRAE